MGEFGQPNIDETVKTAWEMAEEACFNYLCYLTGAKAGYNAFIGDEVTDTTKMNLWAFMLSGGDEQIQNYQCPTPNKRFLVDGTLGGVYKTRKEALKTAGAVMNGMPAYWTDEEDETTPYRGLEPNVSLFELTFHNVLF